jgi:hypothetical protein
VIRDIQILVTEEIIVEVTGLPNEGIQWTGKYTTLKEVVESFVEPGEELDKKGKGLNPTALSEPWRELAGVIQRYITCDGRYDVVRPCHLKLLATLKQRLVINFPFFLNAMLHEVVARTQKAKDPVTIISHHGLVKLIVNRALSQTQITWGDLIEADRPLQIEQPEIHQETPSQGIETLKEEGGSAQIETPLPQPEIEADPIQLAETQTKQEETSKKRRKRTIVVPETSTVKRRRGKKTIQPENIQEAMQTEQPSQDTQENAQTEQPSLENLTEQFFKSYEVEMAQVLGNLGTSVTEDTGRSEEHQAPRGKASWDKGNGMIMDTAGRGESLGSGEDCLMFRQEGLEVLGHGWDLCGLYGVELGYDTRMTFFKKFFHAMRTDDFRRTRSDALKFMFVASLVKLHG